MTRLRRATHDTFRSFARPQLPPVLQRPADLADRQLADARRPDAAGAASSPTAASPSGCWPPPSSARCCCSAPWAGLVADRSDKRRLLMIVQTLRDGCSRSPWPPSPSCGHPPVLAIYAVALLGGIAIAFDNPARRVVRRRDGAGGRHQQRGQPEQRADDRLARRRPGAGRPAGHHRRLRLVLPRSTASRYLAVLVGLWLMRPGRAAPGAGHAAGARARSAKACATPAACPSSGSRW